MNETILSLPVTIEQIAAAIKQMSPDKKRRLLELVPELNESGQRTIAEAQNSLTYLDKELSTLFPTHLLPHDEPFLGNLTLADYLELPDEERLALWEIWSGHEAWIEDSEERDVQPDAMSAR
jgi:hypothetical protein